jgi:hypothetical protein
MELLTIYSNLYLFPGYRIKMRIISDATLEVNGNERHIDVDAETLSYSVRKLLNFATYTFQVVALTKYGEGVHSRVLVASKLHILYRDLVRVIS